MAQFAQRLIVMRQGQVVEVGDVRDIFARPKHPYTQLLIESLPSLTGRGTFEATLNAEAV